MRIIKKLINVWSFYWLMAGLLLGATIHLITILTLPYLSEHKAWDRISAKYPINTMAVLPPITPDSQPLPFMAPDIRYALCRYNIKDRPIKVHANLLNEMWSVAIFNRQGDNVYTLSGENLRSSNVDIKISLIENDALNLGIRPNTAIDPGIPVKVSNAQGLIMVRAPIISEAYTEQALTQLGAANCQLSKR